MKSEELLFMQPHDSRMPYTHATILESHRCAQIIPIAIAHKVVTDFEYRGYLFKAVNKFLPSKRSHSESSDTFIDTVGNSGIRKYLRSSGE